MQDLVAEDQCSLCSRMWTSARDLFRSNLTLPLDKPYWRFGATWGYPLAIGYDRTLGRARTLKPAMLALPRGAGIAG
jgi:hypothetical protein